MDAVKSDPYATDLEAGIAKTTDLLIQKLRKAEESVIERLNSPLEETYRIREEIFSYRNQNRVKSVIKRLRNQIVSLEQFPDLTPSVTPKEELAEEMRKLNFKFHHNIKNLVAEREIGRELRKCESTFTELPNHTDSNPHFQVHSYYWRKPLPVEDLRRYIKIWVGKIYDASSRLVNDSKSSTVTRETYDKLDEAGHFGRWLYGRLDVGREEFKRQFDSMQDVKKAIAEMKFGLYKASMSLEKGYARVERLGKKLVEVEKREKEMQRELIQIRACIRDAERGTELSSIQRYVPWNCK